MQIKKETRYSPVNMEEANLSDLIFSIERVFEDQRGYPTEIEVVDLPQDKGWSKNNLAINNSKVTFFRWSRLRNYVRQYSTRTFLNIKESGWTTEEIKDINSLLEDCLSRMTEKGLERKVESYKYHLVHWYKFTKAVLERENVIN